MPSRKNQNADMFYQFCQQGCALILLAAALHCPLAKADMPSPTSTSASCKEPNMQLASKLRRIATCGLLDLQCVSNTLDVDFKVWGQFEARSDYILEPRTGSPLWEYKRNNPTAEFGYMRVGVEETGRVAALSLSGQNSLVCLEDMKQEFGDPRFVAPYGPAPAVAGSKATTADASPMEAIIGSYIYKISSEGRCTEIVVTERTVGDGKFLNLIRIEQR